MTLLIEDTHDLDRVTRLASRPRPAVEVYVRLPWLDDAERAAAARDLARHLNRGGWSTHWRLRHLVGRLARGGVLGQRATAIGRRES
jgi:hypothetical protein